MERRYGVDGRGERDMTLTRWLWRHIQKRAKLPVRMLRDWSETGQLWAPSYWAIGIYRGSSPFNLRPIDPDSNPVLTAKDVSDVPASFVADPFMIEVDGRWFMFFEVMNTSNEKGEIGLAVSTDLVRWEYRGIVFRQPHHLSYPFVFQSGSKFYMIPEMSNAAEITIFQADSFPYEWNPVSTVVRGDRYVDATILYENGRWWVFATIAPKSDVLRIFHSPRLEGPWIEHPTSTSLDGIGRPAGRIVSSGGNLIRFVQDSSRVYGEMVYAHVIDELTVDGFLESRLDSSPFLGPTGSGWNGLRMHHVDAHQLGPLDWVACLDGSGLGPIVSKAAHLFNLKVHPYP